GWPKFTPFESDFFHDDPLNIQEYDLEYDSDEDFELLE
uniref:AGC-kinase C-terminal domain-containing protein n=1 Tax=Globodera pallida TaxID=36090 RepID=A0A183BYT0_GLOPA